MSQQAFTEITAGERYAVVTVEWLYDSNNEQCLQIVEHTGKLCLAEADFSCTICGKPTCDLHQHLGEHFNYKTMCITCGKLSPAEREKVHQFQLEINK